MPPKGRENSLRRLRADLKQMRVDRRLQQADVADKLDWSVSKLIRIENGSVGISVTDLRALTGLYEAPDGVVDDLVGIVRKTKVRPWWSSYNINPAYRRFIGFEADATRMLQYHLSIVPGLLQTEGYMRALLPAVRMQATPVQDIEELAQVRLKRQKEIIESSSGPEIVMLIDEMALRRPVGGSEVMRGQLEHLQHAGHPDRLQIAVLPLSAGPHVGMQGGFTIMEFAEDVDADLLVQENATGNILLQDQPDLVETYRSAFGKMLERSLRGDDAMRFLRELTKVQ